VVCPRAIVKIECAVGKNRLRHAEIEASRETKSFYKFWWGNLGIPDFELLCRDVTWFGFL
jgi:hypothetical protein